MVHPDIEKHHLKVIGGFQFSSHKSDDEWREFGINHFVIPQVLISNIGQTTYLTYTVERAQFDIEQFKEVVNYFEETQIAKAEHDETLGNILRMEDIYVDEWKELVRDAIAHLMKLKIVLARRRMIKFDKPISIPYVLNRALQSESDYLFILESNQSVFFSQTPEQLLKVEDGVLSTKVYGTIKRSNDIDEDEKIYKHF